MAIQSMSSFTQHFPKVEVKQFNIAGNAIGATYNHNMPNALAATLEKMLDFGGTANIAFNLKNSGVEEKNIAIMVLANRGLPCGAVGKPEPLQQKLVKWVQEVSPEFEAKMCFVSLATLAFKGQEEALVANMVGTKCGFINEKLLNDDYVPVEGEKEQTVATILRQQAFFESISYPWGMQNMSDNAVGNITIPDNINYRKATDADVFRSMYVQDSAEISLVVKRPEGEQTLIVRDNLVADKMLDTSQKMSVTLIFAGAVNTQDSFEKTLDRKSDLKDANGNKIPKLSGTMTRTKNEKAAADYNFFTECIGATLAGTLDTAHTINKKVVILGRAATGLNAKFDGMDKLDHAKKINHDKSPSKLIPEGEKYPHFTDVLENVLNEQVASQTRASYFDRIIVGDVSR